MAIAFISLGSNKGDRLYYIKEAIKLLREKGFDIKKIAPVYETEPVGYENQNWFYNTVIKIETNNSPREILLTLQEIESKLGRKREIRWGPRTIDLDLLYYDDMQITEKDLIVPHPRAEERAFVLKPLADIEPDFILPSGSTVAMALKLLDNGKKVISIKEKI